MTKIRSRCFLQFAVWAGLAVCCYPAWGGIYQHGTVVRMHMGECLGARHGFMANFGGPAVQQATDVCPEYTLISDKVVFVIVGHSSDQIVPLADVVDFRFHKNELAILIDDTKRESKFDIKEMILRSEWEMVQKHISEQLSAPVPADSPVALRTRD